MELKYQYRLGYFVITNLKSLNEIFKVYAKYEQATNAKSNQAKMEGLWEGTWKNRTDSPHKLICRKDSVNLFGVYVGNKDTNESRITLANRNFGEIEAQISNKLSFWKGFPSRQIFIMNIASSYFQEVNFILFK